MPDTYERHSRHATRPWAADRNLYFAVVRILISQRASSWGQHGAHLGPVGPRWTPCWIHEPCYLRWFLDYLANNIGDFKSFPFYNNDGSYMGVVDAMPHLSYSYYVILKPYLHGPLTNYAKLRVAHEPGMPGTFSPPPQVSNPDMYHGTCVTHVPWCMPGSLTIGFLWSRWHSWRMRNP